jgi:hypothetical protein
MKKIVTLVLGLCLLGTFSPLVSLAEKGERKKLTDDQKKVMKEINEKYDTNKDGKLDKEERAKVSADDKKKLKDAGLGHGKKEGDEKKSDSK